MSTSPRALPPSLLPSLNLLLAALALPFNLDDPTDLTPSLLLAIFESLISARLPIPQSVRQSRTRDAKSRAMLVLLGVLECDVLRGGTASSTESLNVDDSVLAGAGGVSVDGWVDEIGLGEVDPERLADGGWDETIFVGELLCWLARRKGILPRTKSSNRSLHHRSLYSKHHSYGESEGHTANFSVSLLLRPSQSETSRSPHPPSPNFSIDDRDPDVDADVSALSHITDVPRHPLVHSPEPSLSASATTGTDLSIRARSVSSHTSVSNVHDDPDDPEEASQDTVQMYDPLRMMHDAEEDDDLPPTFRPQCIHELEDPSYIRAFAGSSSFDPHMSHEHKVRFDDDADRQDDDDLYAPSTPTPRRVRLSGWIEPVDTAAELSHFVASRSHAHSRSRTSNAGFAPPGHSHNPARTGDAGLTRLSQPTSRPVHASPPPRPRSGPRPRSDSLPPSPLPSPSPSPSPSPPHRTAVSVHRLRPHPRSPPSPPSPSTSDAPFDVSFSTLNNTSTPAKPRRPPGGRRGDGRVGGAAPGDTATRRTRHYASPPPGSRGAVRNGTSGSASSSSATTMTMGRTDALGSPGSTATTSALLTERARLLTELAALKRARALSGAGGSADRGAGTRSGGSGVVGRRVDVGV